MIFIPIAFLICSIICILTLHKKVNFSTCITLCVAFILLGFISGMLSTMIISEKIEKTFSAEKFLAENKNIKLEQYKKETVKCKSIYVTEENNRCTIKCKKENDINKKFSNHSNYFVFCTSKDGQKKLEVYEFPHKLIKLTYKEKLLTFLPLRYSLDTDINKFTVYKVYK